MTKEQILKDCTIEGNIVKLPNIQLDRKLYLEVNKALTLIGGKWKGGKVAGFVFGSDPTELLEQVANGEKRNLKKEFQFFATPDNLADELVSWMSINSDFRILEPSAGQGAIIRAINRVLPNKVVDCFELMPINRIFLKKMETANLIGEDFLQASELQYDYIIANPPFSKNQDIDHVYKMYESLAFAGTLVSVMSKHWQFSGNKKETAFRQWLENVDSMVFDVKAGAFKESGTNIESCYVVIVKAE